MYFKTHRLSWIESHENCHKRFSLQRKWNKNITSIPLWQSSRFKIFNAQQQQSKIQSGGGELKIKLDVLFLSVSSSTFIWAPPPTSPSLAAVSFSICWQLHFDEAMKDDFIVLFVGISISETSTDNWWAKFVRLAE